MDMLQMLRCEPMLVQLDPGRHLLVAAGAGGVQVLLELAVAHGGAVGGPVGSVHIAHRTVEVPRHLLACLAGTLHLADLGVIPFTCKDGRKFWELDMQSPVDFLARRVLKSSHFEMSIEFHMKKVVTKLCWTM